MAKRRTSSVSGSLAEIRRNGKQRRTLLAQRERLMEEIESIDAELDSVELALGLRGDAGSPPPPGRKRFRNNQNLVKTLHKALRGQRMSVNDAVVAVRELGYQTTSPNFRIIVNQTLCNHKKEFKRLSRGLYTSR